jgi:uncharacterized membrane protein YdjX (TVP38/TMEM64 family)
MAGRRIGGIAFALAVAALFAALLLTPAGEWLTVAELRESHGDLLAAVDAHPLAWAAGFFCACVGATALCFPAGPVLGVAAGALFGFWGGLGLAAAAWPIGSTLAFLASRYWLRDRVRASLARPLDAIDRGVERSGAWYVLSLRINPLVPYWLVNLAAGVTAMRLVVYVPVTVAGLLPAILVYVTAGAELAALGGAGDVLPLETLAVLLALSLVPLVAVRFASRDRGRPG